MIYFLIVISDWHLENIYFGKTSIFLSASKIASTLYQYLICKIKYVFLLTETTRPLFIWHFWKKRWLAYSWQCDGSPSQDPVWILYFMKVFFYQKKVPPKTDIFYFIFSLVEEKSGLNMKIHLSSICLDVLRR